MRNSKKNNVKKKKKNRSAVMSSFLFDLCLFLRTLFLCLYPKKEKNGWIEG